MKFKAYDILSSLIPGFIILFVVLKFLNLSYNKDFVIPYTVIAFFLGYIVNSLSSWFEDFYFFTWGGKPSSSLISGKGIWKVKFYEHQKTKKLLIKDCSLENPINDQLFSIAKRYTNGSTNERIKDFNANYAFTRSLLTTTLISSTLLIIDNYDDLRYYAVLIPILVITWLRCKQRAYYYAREVLNGYLTLKEKIVTANNG